MIRARFVVVGVEDYRPVHWPVKHPYWCSGYDSNMNPVIVAYADDEDEIKKNWPEATGIDSEPVTEYMFSGRFPKPKWFN